MLFPSIIFLSCWNFSIYTKFGAASKTQLHDEKVKSREKLQAYQTKIDIPSLSLETQSGKAIEIETALRKDIEKRDENIAKLGYKLAQKDTALERLQTELQELKEQYRKYQALQEKKQEEAEEKQRKIHQPESATGSRLCQRVCRTH